MIARLRSLWRGLTQRSAIESEMDDEFRHHIELRAQDLMRAGVPGPEAMRQARREFGSPARFKQESRASRGLQRIDVLRFSWLDFKLGFRMLTRYPGLTVVGGLAIAFAVWTGAGTFELIGQWIYPSLPLPDGDRIVALQLRNTALNMEEDRLLHDYVVWREELEAVEDVSAYRTVERNLVVDEGIGIPVVIAEISASAFRVAGVQPQAGRVLLESDEQPGAAPVLVISHEIWQMRFGGAAVLGRAVRLGQARASIVGVMPEDFAFPVSHEAWMPLRLRSLDYAPLEGPGLAAFARLAPGVTLGDAQTQIDYLGERMAADFPATHAHLRPRVLPYAQAVLGDFINPGEAAALPWLNVFVVMLFLLVCGNVALLMFARATTRESEVVVRSALGASRGRVVAQLFAEAIVLASLGAALGLALTRPGLQWMMQFLEGNLGRLPFWIDDSISVRTLLYSAILTALGAVVAGVLPALRVTRGLGTRLRQASAGGGGVKFSGIWTVIIVAQVAVTVMFPVSAFSLVRLDARIRAFDAGFASEQFASARLELGRDNTVGLPLDSTAAGYLDRYHRTYRELERRLLAEPTVEAVTFASTLPRMHHGERRIDAVEGVPTSEDSLYGEVVNTASVDIDYFDALGTPIAWGRGFDMADVESGNRVLIVNRSFVDNVLDGQNPLGRHVRFEQRQNSTDPLSAMPGPWYEIIGVAPDLGMNYLGSTEGNGAAGVYEPLSARRYPVMLAVKVRDDPASFAPRLHAVAQAVDPTLRLHELQLLDGVQDGIHAMIANLLRISLVTCAVALLLSLAGIYTVMSFTVSRRTREIGVRVALGADPRRIMLATFARPLAQVSAGILAGAWLVAALIAGDGLLVTSSHDRLAAQEIVMIIAYAALMLGVCLLACVVPVRRALAVEPTVALRADG